MKLPTGVRKGYQGQFESKIMINGRVSYIGTFDTPEEAHKAYLEKRALYPKRNRWQKE